jgi:Reverse transcriptase (RNA-dependent DNA polymerase)
MYEITRSPLYGQKSIHLLARLLEIPIERLRDTKWTDTHYRLGTVEKKKKTRETETPIRILRRVHEKLLSILTRINLPDYLHSGRKGRSYISNASVHQGAVQTYCIDISAFFGSITWHHVYASFVDNFKCHGDIAGILASLCTYRNHLPTGSPLSTLLSYFAMKSMFDNLYESASNNNLQMSVILDDVTFSGADIPPNFKRFVQDEIRRNDLKTSKKKEKFYHGGRPAEVTGIIVHRDHLSAPWQRHARMKTAITVVNSVAQDGFKSAYSRAMSTISEIEAVEKKNTGLKEKVKMLRLQRKVPASKNR